jgi:Domain of unknown function (DUF1707)
MTGESDVRVGDAERDAAVASLGEHYAAGRLTREEYDERSDAAFRARTASQLRRLFADLPQAPSRRSGLAAPPRRPSPPAGWGGPGVRLPLLPLILLAIGLSIVLHFPVWLFVLVAWCWWGGPWGGRWTHRRRW